MFSIAHGGENCNILRRIFARMRERRGILSPFAAPRAPPPLARARRPKRAAAPLQGRAGNAAPLLRRGGFGFFPCRRARMGAAAGSGELGRKGAAAGERERKEGAGRGSGGGKKEEAFGNFAERFVWGLICFAAMALE